MTDFKFYAFYTSSKQGVPALTPTVDVYDGSGTLIVNSDPAIEIGGGLYSYIHSSSSHDDFVAIFKTSDTSVDMQHLPSLAAQQISELPDNVWNAALSGYAIPGSAGAKLSCVPCLGIGSVHWDYTLYEPDLVTPVPYALVQISTDIAGTVMIAGGYTGSDGKVWFNLDPGTYYLWSFKVGYSFSNPDTEVVP